MAEVLGVMSAALGGADVCLRLVPLGFPHSPNTDGNGMDVTSAGRSLYSRYRSYKDAEQDLKDLAWLLKNNWLKIESKVILIKDLQNVLEENLKLHFQELFEILSRKLQDAEMKIESIDRKQGRLRRVKFAALVKGSLEGAIAELEKWQAQFELPYFLIARISNPAVDQQLTDQRNLHSESARAIKKLRETIRPGSPGPEKPIFISVTDLAGGGRLIDPYTSMKLVKESGAEGKEFLMDVITQHVGYVLHPDVVTMGIRDVARVLAQADPLTFGILTCHGVVKSTEANGALSFQFVFEIPETLRNPRSLRSLLADSRGQRRPTYPLNERFELAKRLCRSVMFVHSSNLVHKNIRPETVAIFQDKNTLLGIPFLVGFEKIRSIHSFTLLMGDSEWEKNLYRHPNRQGLRPEDSYKMQHDIYSLGVCLLEIGLWSSFVCWSEQSRNFEPGPDLKISSELEIKDQRKKANEIKVALLKMAYEQLPGAMGPKYAEVVISCLTCLDRGNDGFGSEEDLTDADGIMVGVRYVEMVAMRLEEISV